MDAQKVDMFIMTNGKFFPQEQLPFIKEKLLALDDSKWTLIQAASFSDPTIYLIVSLFLGYLGIDRFMLGETGLGVLKLITCGGCGIWAIIDWFTVMQRTREKNIRTLDNILTII